MGLLALFLIDVLTYHNDLARTGQNLSETALTPQTVNATQFGKRLTYPVDGAVYGQPLIYNGSVYIVTEHDSVYAFSEGGPTWKVSLLPAGATTVPSSDVNCGQIAPEIGITATPVIDPATNTIYVVAMSKENGGYVHRLHALDTATGAERPNSPVVVTASIPGKGDGGSMVTLVAKNYKERAGLVLSNGVVYTTWASHCDEFLYHGWVISYDAKTLAQVGVYNNTPNQKGASFWTSGAAPAVDAAGNVYVVGGNGSFDGEMTNGIDLGNSFIKLTSSLSVMDWFAPFNFQSLNDRDLDIGSSGALLLPDAAGSSAHPHLLVSAGKEGRIYLVDRDNMGKYQTASDSQIVQSITGAISPLFGIPAYFNNTVYFAGDNDFLKAFSIRNAAMSTSPISQTSARFAGFGGAPVVSANGTTGGIVWISQNTNGGSLAAYDATDLTKLLYSAPLGSNYVKFSSPTVTNGKVYVGTQNSLVVFGLAANAAPVAVNAASYVPNVAPGSIVSVFGTNLTNTTGQANGYPLPTSLAGVTIDVGGKQAPLYYAGPTQINFQVPVDIPANLQTLTVNTPTGAVSAGTLGVQATAPGVFVIANQSGSINASASPAAPASTVIVYVTGIGPVDNPVATGAAAPTATLSRATAPVNVTVNGTAATVSFAGLAPGFAGLGQLNVQVPSSLDPGTYPLVVNIGGVAASTVMLVVR